MRITNLKPLISEEAIQTRVKEMAGEISILYKDEPLVVVCVLKGAFMFFSDLVRHLTCKPELDFVRLASYGSAAQRSKTITFTKDVEIPLEGKHVLIVEDIVDTGHSMDFLYRQFQAVYGETPYAYAKRRRMETAALWLQTTDMPVGRIAGALGYQNASKFSQAFAAFYGVPPTAYKKGLLLD